MKNTTKVGIIGCGNISWRYLTNARRMPNLEVVALADIIHERAVAKAAEFGIPRAVSNRQLLADPEVEIVLNLTPPKVHAKIALAALRAGKHVYNEKPLATRLEDGRKILALAKARKLRVGDAPDTVLGAGIQTCRKLIDDGAIGTPIAASAFMMSRGMENWHPDPDFFFQPGGGPLFDMGPYYLTALVTLLGPVRRVTGSARTTFPTRTITSKPKYGQKIHVHTPTHVVGVLDFASGAIGTLVTSFDVWGARLPNIEIYGSDGSLGVPDPNCFDGPVTLLRGGDRDWKPVKYTHAYSEESRSMGLSDMANAIRLRRPHRANSEIAFHVLEIFHSLYQATRTNRHVFLKSTCQRPRPIPPGLRRSNLYI